MNKNLPAALGTADFGTSISERDSFRLLDTFAALGGRIIDTANIYAYWFAGAKGGESEKTIGKWLCENKSFRNEFTVMTKIGSMPLDRKNRDLGMEGLSAVAVKAAVENCLRRLNADCLDLLFIHHDHGDIPLEETWKALSYLVDAGKVSRLGVSNFRPERLAELSDIISAESLAPLSAIQMKHSLIAPVADAVFDMLEVLDEECLRVIKKNFPEADILGYSPLLGGLFEKDADGDWPANYDTKENRNTVKALQSRARKEGISPSSLVLKTIADSGIIPVTSTSRPQRLTENLQLLHERQTV